MDASCKSVAIKNSIVFLVLIFVAACAGSTAARRSAVERMYVLECGQSRTPDVSRWSPGVDVGKPREFSDNCYLIRHAKGLMLWDTGMSDSIADMPDGLTVGGGVLTLWVRKTLKSQLEALGVAPGEIRYIAFSHMHADHVGNANLFTGATLYMQEAGYEAAFGTDPGKYNYVPALYEKLRNNPAVKLNGDHDVFGDGSVVILSTPGHTPGHQSLLVRLAKTGPVVLSGDMVHFRENWENRRVPAGNYDRELSLRSMEKVAGILSAENATLWINHDKSQSAGIPKAPAYVD